ncbi:MAG: DUF4349 domain-containing protein [Actinobacteria bacterium]|nr:DUF4349 domain-containing protein [Actinomycetota bacterium]
MKNKGLSLKLLFILLVSILISGMIFTGCSAKAAEESAAVPEGEFATADESVVAMEEEAQAERATEEEFAEEKVAADTETQYGEVPVAGDRKVIKTAYIELEIEVGKFESTMFGLTNLAEQNGGFVSNSQSYSDSEGNLTSGSVTIRIPSNKYNSALNRVKEMGTVKSTSSAGQDVTQEYTDLESRLKNYEVQEKVLRDLMKESKKVSDTLEVQIELSKVQEQIEVIKGRMQYLDELVSFSTIDVYFHEPEPITVAGWGFVEALKRGLRGAVNVFNWLVVAIIITAPLWILIGIILIIVRQVIKARKRRRARKEQK